MSLSRRLKNWIKSIAGRLGFILEKKTPLNTESLLLRHLLASEQIDCVLDVGANTGQFALELIDSQYNNDIISFEPLPDAFKTLQQKARAYSRWQVRNYAVGNETGTIAINVAANSESSSVLPMLPTHENLAPESAYIGSINVPLCKLDDCSEDFNRYQHIMLKIDVQGFEEAVIDGALGILPKVKILQMEMSFIQLYASGVIYYDLLQKMESLGFSLYTFLPAFSDYKTGQVFQVDAVFLPKIASTT